MERDRSRYIAQVRMPGVATTNRSKPEIRSWTWRNLWIWQFPLLVPSSRPYIFSSGCLFSGVGLDLFRKPYHWLPYICRTSAYHTDRQYLSLILDSIGIHNNRTKNVISLARVSWALVKSTFSSLIAPRYPWRRIFLVSNVVIDYLWCCSSNLL